MVVEEYHLVKAESGLIKEIYIRKTFVIVAPSLAYCS